MTFSSLASKLNQVVTRAAVAKVLVFTLCAFTVYSGNSIQQFIEAFAIPPGTIAFGAGDGGAVGDSNFTKDVYDGGCGIVLAAADGGLWYANCGGATVQSGPASFAGGAVQIDAAGDVTSNGTLNLSSPNTPTVFGTTDAFGIPGLGFLQACDTTDSDACVSFLGYEAGITPAQIQFEVEISLPDGGQHSTGASSYMNGDGTLPTWQINAAIGLQTRALAVEAPGSVNPVITLYYSGDTVQIGTAAASPATTLGQLVTAAQVCPNVEPDGGGCSVGGGGGGGGVTPATVAVGAPDAGLFGSNQLQFYTTNSGDDSWLELYGSSAPYETIQSQVGDGTNFGGLYFGQNNSPSGFSNYWLQTMNQSNRLNLGEFGYEWYSYYGLHADVAGYTQTGDFHYCDSIQGAGCGGHFGINNISPTGASLVVSSDGTSDDLVDLRLPDAGPALSIDSYGDLTNAGSLSVPVTLITSSGNVSAQSHVVEINATSGSVTATLPVPTTDTGRRYVIKRIDSTASNAVAINTTSSTAHNSAGLVQANVLNMCSNLVIPTADLNSVAVWFYFVSSSNADAVIFADNSVVFARSYSAYISTSNNHLNFAYNTAGGVVDMGAISTSTWYQFVVTYDGTSARPYLNGVTAGPVTSPGPTSSTTTCFGYDSQNFNTTFTGNVSEAGAWASALSGAQVAALYAAGLAGGTYDIFSTPPTIYWPFFALSGSQFPTTIGSSNYNLDTSGVVLSSNTPLSGNTLIDGLMSYPLSVGTSVEMTSDGTEYRILGTGGVLPQPSPLGVPSGDVAVGAPDAGVYGTAPLAYPWMFANSLGGALPSFIWAAQAGGHIAERYVVNSTQTVSCTLGSTTYTDGGWYVVYSLDAVSGHELCLVTEPCSLTTSAAAQTCQPDAGTTFAQGDPLIDQAGQAGVGATGSCPTLPTCVQDVAEGFYP